MPHVILEYTKNLPGFDPQAALAGINRALAASGHVQRATDIKSRAVALECFRVGNDADGHGFVHVTLALFGGRDTQARKALSALALAALQQSTSFAGARLHIQFTVEFRALDREAYSKATVAGD